MIIKNKINKPGVKSKFKQTNVDLSGKQNISTTNTQELNINSTFKNKQIVDSFESEDVNDNININQQTKMWIFVYPSQ